jgi:DNA-directed RNA polymerase specialized sigma24 family protein
MDDFKVVLRPGPWRHRGWPPAILRRFVVTYATGIDEKTVLGLLVGRIAHGDRAAFRRLYARLHSPVCDHVDEILSRRADVPAVVSSTFVEVWWLARHHAGTGTDVRTWIAGIARARATERERGPERYGLLPAEASHVALRQLLGESGTSARARRAVSA